MKSKYEFNTGTCERCGCVVNPENLFIDIYEHMYTLTCPKCFYKRNTDKETKYLDRIKEVLPDIETPEKYEKIKNKPISIGNTYPYLKPKDGLVKEPFSRMERTQLVDVTLKNFFSLQKIRTKFTVDKAMSKCSSQNSELGYIFLVAVVAKVRFNSYLEFLEHKLFQQFRKDCPTVLR